MSSFGSDGAAVLSGNKNGVWTKLKNENSSLITNHCKDHRLALACKDSFKSVKTMKRLDDMLDNVHQYYKFSANCTKTRKCPERIGAASVESEKSQASSVVKSWKGNCGIL